MEMPLNTSIDRRYPKLLQVNKNCYELMANLFQG